MDGWLAASGGAYLRSGAEMAGRLRQVPRSARADRGQLAAECAFDFQVIAPKLPDFPVPGGHSEATWLCELVARKAPERYGPPGGGMGTGGLRPDSPRARRSSRISGFPGYFLIVHDIVRFCEESGHPVPGPGIGGQLSRLLRARDHQRGPGPARAALRALPVGGPGRPARYRPGHRAPAPRGGDPVRLQHLRQGQGRPGRQCDLLPAADGAARRRAGARLPAGAAERLVTPGRTAAVRARASRSRPTRGSPRPSSSSPGGCSGSRVTWAFTPAGW